MARRGQGGPGGRHIVDEPDLFGQVPSARTACESPEDVALTGPGVEARLGGGLPGPNQPARNEGVSPEPGDFPSDEGRGVEAPAPEAASVQGDGDDPIPLANFRLLGQRSGEEPHNAKGSGIQAAQALSRVFEAMNPGAGFPGHGQGGDGFGSPPPGQADAFAGFQPGELGKTAGAESVLGTRAIAARA